jgi:hypothetical protein
VRLKHLAFVRPRRQQRREDDAYKESKGWVQGQEHQDKETNDQEESKEAVSCNKNNTKEAGETWEK